jgi:hypothetical protein
MKEREMHSHLYEIKPLYENNKVKIDDLNKVIGNQREALWDLIHRLNQYSKAEPKDYPPELLKKGIIDLDVWQASRGTKFEEQPIQDLRK